MAAFEQEHKRRLNKFERTRKDGSVGDEEAEYLLKVGSMLKEFYIDQKPVAIARPQRNVPNNRKPRKRRELSAVEKSGSVQAWMDVKSQQQEGALLKKYSEQFGSKNITSRLQTCDMHFGNPEDEDLCPTCRLPCVIDGREATMICTSCGLSRDYMEGSAANMTYDQEMSIATSSNSPYERMNHLNELLAQIQGKETTLVPPELLDAVRVEFKKDGVSRKSQVTTAATLRYLKKLGESDWVRTLTSSWAWQEPEACTHLCAAMRRRRCTRIQTCKPVRPNPAWQLFQDPVVCCSSRTAKLRKWTQCWTTQTLQTAKRSESRNLHRVSTSLRIVVPELQQGSPLLLLAQEKKCWILLN